MLGVELGAQPAAAAPPAEVREALEVKNTFIDLNRRGAADGSDIYKRQVSEPAPSMLRQLSGQGQLMWRPSHVDASPLGGGTATKLLEEAELFDDEGGGGGQGLGFDADDPGNWLVGCRGFGRQETEQVWPSWPGFAADLPNTVDLAAAIGVPPPDFLPQPPGDISAAFAASTAVAAAVAATAAAAAAADAGPLPFDPPGFSPCGQSSSSTAMPPSSWEPKAPYRGGAATASGVATAAAAASARDLLQDTGDVASLATPPLPLDWANTTTVMMRNLPNKYTQAMLIEELSSVGFEGAFDFLYLPIDPETHANRGYAFLNLVEPTLAWMLKNAFEGRKMSCFNSDKVVSVAPAALQGFEANYAHYSTSRVNRGDPSARPLFLRGPSEGGGGHSGQGGGEGGSGNGRGTRRRGGRRGTGSLIDMATRQQQKIHGGDYAPFQSAAPHASHDQVPLHFQQQRAPPQWPPPAQLQPQQLQQLYDATPSHAAPWDPEVLRGAPQAQPGRGAALQGPPGAQPKGAAGQGFGADRTPMAKFCPYCGGRASSHFNFCSFCGSSLDLTGPP